MGSLYVFFLIMTMGIEETSQSMGADCSNSVVYTYGKRAKSIEAKVKVYLVNWIE